MKKFIALSVLPFALASFVLASTIVASPPDVDVSGWKKVIDMEQCKEGGFRRHVEGFLQKDGDITPDNGLYERRIENGVVVAVRYAEFRNNVRVRDDVYLNTGKWIKFDILSDREFDLYMDTLRTHPNLLAWRSSEVPCPK